jgi:hypothetical protein
VGFVLPPAKTKAQSGQQAVFKQYINAHPTMRDFAQPIYRYALDYGVDPVFYASLLWKESFAAAKAQGKDPVTIVSPTGKGVGLAQVNPDAHVGEPVPWAPGRRITAADLRNPTFSLRFGAYYFAQGLTKYGSYQDAYTQFYNPGYTGAVFQDVPKTYVPTTTAKSPTDSATTSVETAAAKAALLATWAVHTKEGKVKFVTSASPPKGTLSVFGDPVSKQAFLQLYSGIQDDYLAYTGKRPSFAQAATLIAKGTSQFQLRQQLSQTPGFVGSPVWKQNAPGYVAVWHQLYGQDSAPDQAAVRKAVATNIGGSAFADELRSRPDYTTSTEFKDAYAANENVFRQIYGEPEPADKPVIEGAVKNGYDANAFASYLRQQPQWKGSVEAKQLWYGLADRMGLVPGKDQTVLSNG